MRSGEIPSGPSSSRRLRRAPISCRRNAPTPTRNATHTTSGGTSTLKSLITRAPSFRSAASSFLSAWDSGSAFLLRLAAGAFWSATAGAVFGPKPNGDQLAFWPPSSRHPLSRPGPGDISPARTAVPLAPPSRSYRRPARTAVPLIPPSRSYRRPARTAVRPHRRPARTAGRRMHRPCVPPGRRAGHSRAALRAAGPRPGPGQACRSAPDSSGLPPGSDIPC